VASTALLVAGQQTWDAWRQSRVPDALCAGMLPTDEVRDGREGRAFDEFVRRAPGLGSPSAWCEVGRDVTLRADPLPTARDLARQTIEAGTGFAVPLGAGIEGMAAPDGGWLVMSCPEAGSAEPVLVRVTYPVAPVNGVADDTDRERVAGWLTRAGRHIADTAGCGVVGPPDAPLPEASTDPAPVERDGLCGLAPAGLRTPQDADRLHTSIATPAGGPLHTCSILPVDDRRTTTHAVFGVVRGHTTAYAPTHARERLLGGGDVVGGVGAEDAWLRGTCGGEPVSFFLDSDNSFLPRSSERTEQVFRALVSGYAAREGCVVPPGVRADRPATSVTRHHGPVPDVAPLDGMMRDSAIRYEKKQGNRGDCA